MRMTSGHDRPSQPPRTSPLPALGPNVSIIDVAAALRDRGVLKHLVRFSLGHLGEGASPEDAEDALQQFLVARLPSVLKLHKPEIRPFWGYFCMCLKRFCWDLGKEIRKRASMEPLSIDDPAVAENRVDEGLGPHEVVAVREARSHVSHALEHLPERLQEILHLFYEQGLSESEIAGRLGITLALAKTLLLRARRRLAPHLAHLSDVSFNLLPSDITDWPGLCKRLTEASPLLPPDAQTAVLAGCSDGIDQDQCLAILHRINALLGEKTLCKMTSLGKALAQGHGPPEICELFLESRSNSISLLRLNRFLLEDLLRPHLAPGRG